MRALALSSTIGAEITAPKFSPTRTLLVAAVTINSLAVFKRKAIKTATSAPQKKAVASIHKGSAS